MKPVMNYVQMGKGKPLLLIHGLGGSWQSWNTIITQLSVNRKVIALDLPGFGETPQLESENTFSSLCTEVTSFIMTHNLQGIDVVGSSMGARIALELSRRGGIVGSVVALDPGGFWNRFSKFYFYIVTALSHVLVKLLQPFMKQISESILGRKILLFLFSYDPKKIAPETMLHEMRDYAKAQSFQKILFDLAFGRTQQGMNRKQEFPITIVWGKNDRVCFKHQARRAMQLFPKAKLIWLEKCGHFPQWDRPQETLQIILAATSHVEDLQHAGIPAFQRTDQNVNVVRQ